MKLLATFFLSSVGALSCGAVELDRTIIPLPEPAFEGKIGETYKDSESAWPKLPAPPAGAPNVVVILLDDVGFGQTGTFGGPIPTPALDKLASNGLRYTRFHTTAICGPSRAALITGRNHHNAGSGFLAEWATGFPSPSRGLSGTLISSLAIPGTQTSVAAALVCTLAFNTTPARAADPLSSWNDTAPKQAIVAFVEKVTKPGSPDFVPVAERIATFDNDGTLWSEQPMYFQAFFIFDRIKALAPQHPEWSDKEPFASILKGDLKSALAGGEHSVAALLAATHAGMTTEEFEKIVKDWITTAKHPKRGKPFTGMVFQPMLELLTYLRANGFKTFWRSIYPETIR